MVRRIKFKAVKYFLILLIAATLIFWVIGCDILGFKDIDMRDVIDDLTTKDPVWHMKGEERIAAPEPATDLLFGTSADIDGDYAVVGAFGFDGYRGIAYIFKWNSYQGIWEKEADLDVAGGLSGRLFGHSVSISGSYAIVGASGIDTAYVFVRSGTSWSLDDTLTGTTGHFGCSVSVYGTYAIVGDYDGAGSATTDGAAYVYERIGPGNWAQKSMIRASGGIDGDRFGNSVSISETYAFVGAKLDDVGSNTDEGSVYVFKRDASGNFWGTASGNETAALNVDKGSTNLNFGQSVSVSGSQAVIGAPTGTSVGSAYLFENISGWVQTEKLVASDGSEQDKFGYTVSISQGNILIGAYADADKGTNSGSAYYFVEKNNIWEQKQKITVDDGNMDDQFGCSVSIEGKYAVIGANGVDSGAFNSAGAAYIYELY